MKHRSKRLSPRLERVRATIEAAGERGITTFTLGVTAAVTDAKDAIYELNRLAAEGIQPDFVIGEWIRTKGKPPKHFKRYWLERFHRSARRESA